MIGDRPESGRGRSRSGRRTANEASGPGPVPCAAGEYKRTRAAQELAKKGPVPCAAGEYRRGQSFRPGHAKNGIVWRSHLFGTAEEGET